MFVHGRDYLQIDAPKARGPEDRAAPSPAEISGFCPAPALSTERFGQFRAIAAINTDTEI